MEVVASLRVPAPVPMLQVTPALDESLATFAAKVWLEPWLRDAVVGLTLTVIAGGGFCEPPPPPPPQPASVVRIDVPHAKKSKGAPTLGMCKMGLLIVLEFHE